jgi:uncharacterized protein YceH (UPF0502 family)
MAEFADLPAVAEAVRRLSTREVPLVVQLAHLPGKREDRFAHLLCGEPVQELAAHGAESAAVGRRDLRDERIAALEAQVAALSAQLDALWDLTGLAERRPRD